MDLKSLREKRGKLVEEGKQILSKAQTEGRDLTAEETAKHGDLFKQQDEVRKQIEAVERQQELDREMAASKAATDAQDRAKDDNKAAPDEVRSMSALLKRDVSEQDCILFRKQMKGFRGWLQGGPGNPEFRALQADVDTAGGFLVAPEQFVQSLIKAVDNEVFIRRRATIFQVPNAEKLGVPSLDNDPDDADWTAEIATGNEDSTMSLGKRQFTPHPLAKRIKVSNTLLRKSVIPAESLVTGRLAYKFGVTEEKGFLTGNGSGQPLGLFTASDDGIPTSRDISTGNAQTAVTFDGLISAKYALKGQYWARAAWLFHRDAMAMISKLKDGNGQYLWRASTRDGEPDTVLGHPVMVSEYVPNTFTAGLYAGMIADFSHYWIADALSMQVQRLMELYAETNQTGFIGRLETDGMPVLSEAFARVTLAP